MLLFSAVLVASKPAIERGCVAGAASVGRREIAAEIVMFVVEPLETSLSVKNVRRRSGTALEVGVLAMLVLAAAILKRPADEMFVAVAPPDVAKPAIAVQ